MKRDPRSAERDALVAQMAAEEAELARLAPDALPLDHSYASLDRVEDAFRDDLVPQVAAYLGNTLAERTGGKWDVPRREDDLGRPVITDIPGLRKLRFVPLANVLTFKRSRAPGSLRNVTERYDLPLRRTTLATLLSEREARTEDLRAQMASLLDRDPGPLDGSAASVRLLEAALVQLVARNSSREVRRRFRDNAVLYLGAAIERAVGGSWGVRDDPEDGDLGELEIHGWTPMNVVRNASIGNRPDLLQGALDRVIAARSKK
jgi:hypothetical protein